MKPFLRGTSRVLKGRAAFQDTNNSTIRHYRRIADQTCSATTLRRRRDEWVALGLAERLRLAVLGAYDRIFGLELDHLALDGCSTKAPCGGQVAGPSPVDRRKQG
jgi:hypothetical protein